MKLELNALGQPVGALLPLWKPPPPPPRITLTGRFCRLEPLTLLHADALDAANRLDVEGRGWTYLSYGPFTTLEEYCAWVAQASASDDPLFLAVVAQDTEKPVGIASYLRIQPQIGVVEIGHLHYSPLLQRTPAGTEAISLMLAQVFALGYRRCEWKCDALNAASRAAAERLGFTFEGVFRQATITRGRNRDTAWFSIIDEDWPRLDTAFRQWLDPANFGEDGSQRAPLSVFRGSAQAAAAAAKAE